MKKSEKKRLTELSIEIGQRMRDTAINHNTSAGFYICNVLSHRGILDDDNVQSFVRALNVWGHKHLHDFRWDGCFNYAFKADNLDACPKGKDYVDCKLIHLEAYLMDLNGAEPSKIVEHLGDLAKKPKNKK